MRPALPIAPRHAARLAMLLAWLLTAAALLAAERPTVGRVVSISGMAITCTDAECSFLRPGQPVLEQDVLGTMEDSRVQVLLAADGSLVTLGPAAKARFTAGGARLEEGGRELLRVHRLEFLAGGPLERAFSGVMRGEAAPGTDRARRLAAELVRIEELRRQEELTAMSADFLRLAVYAGHGLAGRATALRDSLKSRYPGLQP